MRIIPRVIPVLLLSDEQFVKTVRFRDARYVGDPINVINLFNRFEVDEIAVLDIRATVDQMEPVFELIEQLAAECWVPLTYGGGLRSVDSIRRTLSVGIEKVVLGTAVADDPSLVPSAAQIFGGQAIVVAIDAMATPTGSWEVAVSSGRRVVSTDVVAYARAAEAMGAGEILLTSIDRDGSMLGYDVPLISAVSAAVNVPVIACGGAGRRPDLAEPVAAGASAVGAGSIFVFQGPERGVLVNFPTRDQLEQLFAAEPSPQEPGTTGG